MSSPQERQQQSARRGNVQWYVQAQAYALRLAKLRREAVTVRWCHGRQADARLEAIKAEIAELEEAQRQEAAEHGVTYRQEG